MRLPSENVTITMGRLSTGLQPTFPLSNDAMKNPGENSTWPNMLEGSAISLRIDAPCHRLSGFGSEQADRELVRALSSEDGRDLDVTDNDTGRRADQFRGLTRQAQSA